MAFLIRVAGTERPTFDFAPQTAARIPLVQSVGCIEGLALLLVAFQYPRPGGCELIDQLLECHLLIVPARLIR